MTFDHLTWRRPVHGLPDPQPVSAVAHRETVQTLRGVLAEGWARPIRIRGVHAPSWSKETRERRQADLERAFLDLDPWMGGPDDWRLPEGR